MLLFFSALAASSGTAAMMMVVNSTLRMGDSVAVSEDVYAGQSVSPSACVHYTLVENA